MQAHGGRVVALGKFRESAAGAGDIEPRSVLILVNGTKNYVWHLFDKLSDLRPILK